MMFETKLTTRVENFFDISSLSNENAQVFAGERHSVPGGGLILCLCRLVLLSCLLVLNSFRIANLHIVPKELSLLLIRLKSASTFAHVKVEVCVYIHNYNKLLRQDKRHKIRPL